MTTNTTMTENQDQKYVTCSDCGQRILKDDAIETEDGRFICKDCFDDDYVICRDCDAVIRRDDAVETEDGEFICQDCCDDDYIICEDCGLAVRSCDAVSIDGGEFYVCQDCADNNYHYCDHCGNYFTEDNIWADDGNLTICNDCCDDYVICEDCGRIVEYDEANWSEYEECYYCEDCYRDHHQLLHEYGYKPDPEFQDLPADRADGNKFYFGVELETDGGEDVTGVCQSLQELDLPIYCKHDSSLRHDGVEIVTHPGTVEFHRNAMDWDKICQVCVNHDYTSHDSPNCGLHVHVSRAALGSSWEEQEDTAYKMVILGSTLREELTRFSRRKPEKLDDWAKFFSLEGAEVYENTVLDYTKSCFRRDWRYQAVNLTNDHTVEIRIFRGSLLPTTVIAAVQLVNNWAKYAKNHTPWECYKASWEDLLSEEEFSELRAYCADHKLS